VEWHGREGRKGLPWQGTRDPYRIWLSEVMLQQTQVAAVIPYYERFLERFPTIEALAQAEEEDVLQLWSGLGYYARGRNLHRASLEIVSVHHGRFPKTAAELQSLPGLGRSSAAAIAAFAFGERAAILDGNVKRVLARHAGIQGFPGDKEVENQLWGFAEKLLPERGIEIYTQAMMDLGATVCVRSKPRCEACPVRKTCVARKKGWTDSIPSPRPKKPLPSKDATWWLVRHKGDILLERRPSSGLWGGLWTFPESQPAGLKLTSRRELPMLEHGFTHFKLRIHPVLCEAARIDKQRRGLWIDLDEAKTAAVPAPVRTLLERIS
jgi:A/G-specific adenine glycosylase